MLACYRFRHYETIVDKIGIKEVVVGYDYTFGHKRQGNITILREMGVKLGFRVHVMEPVHIDRALVSSTSIRKHIQEGSLLDAKKILGRCFVNKTIWIPKQLANMWASA